MILKIQKKTFFRTSYLSDAETQFFCSGSDQYRFGSEQYFSTVFRITQILLRIIRITTFSLPDQLPYGFFRMTEVGCMRICFPQIFQFAQICTLNFYIFNLISGEKRHCFHIDLLLWVLLKIDFCGVKSVGGERRIRTCVLQHVYMF